MRNLRKQLIPTIPLAIVGLILPLHGVHAAGFLGLDLALTDALWVVVSNIMQIFLTGAAWLVGLTGTLLNVSMFLTTHLGAFINDTPIIYSVWNIIRDLASIVLIFFILWAALQMILRIQQADYGGLIRSIVIMGILINFSFFFARVLIDASNIVSLQFYNAIAPGKEYVAGTSVHDWTLKSFQDGGLSNVFMGSLKVNEWYSNRGVLGNTAEGGASDPRAAPIRIFLVTIGGIIVMILASMSFLGAAVAALLRIAILVFLLAFSPIWIASIALPQVREHTRIWWNYFKAQLLFLPVYLLFMYVAVRILTESNLRNLTASSGATLSQSNLNDYVSLFVGFAIVIIMLNLPLFAAIKISGAGGAITEKWFKGAQNWGLKWFGGRGSGYGEAQLQAAWRQTGGRIASRIAQNESFQTAAGRYRAIGGRLALQTTRGIAASYDKQLAERVESREKFGKSLGKEGALAYAQSLSRSIPARLSILHTIGKANRVGAAKILNARASEIKGDLDKLTSELRKLEKEETRVGFAALKPYEKDRLDKLRGTNINGNNPSTENEIDEAQDKLTGPSGVQAHIDAFKTTHTTSTGATIKRGY